MNTNLKGQLIIDNELNNANGEVSQPKQANKTNRQGKAKGKAKERTTYQKNVIDVNQSLKQERAKLGYCITELVKYEGTPANFIKLLKQAQRDSNMYKQWINEVRTTKTGKYCAFYLLQYLHKLSTK